MLVLNHCIFEVFLFSGVLVVQIQVEPGRVHIIVSFLQTHVFIEWATVNHFHLAAEVINPFDLKHIEDGQAVFAVEAIVVTVKDDYFVDGKLL